MKFSFLLSLLFFASSFSGSNAQTNSPFYYWTFDEKEAGKDNIKQKELNTSSYQCDYTSVIGKSGKGIDLGNANCLVVTSALKSNIKDEFTVEFFFKGTALKFLTFPQQLLNIQFNYSGFSFRTSIKLPDGKVMMDDFSVALKGAGRQSYNYYTDNNWHHLVFTASLKKGKKEIWVDGECSQGFSKPIAKGTQFEFGNSDGFRSTDQIDELAFYNTVLPEELIRQHLTQVNSGASYTFSVKKNLETASRISRKASPETDAKEYAPGYPDYTVQATDQLKSFPLPRYNSAQETKRNMSWMDIGYLHRELPGKGGKGLGKQNPIKAIELAEEMAKYWNYYLDIPTLRITADGAAKQYGDKNSLYGALVDFANRYPQYPVSTILVEAQVKPVHAGFESSNAYLASQNLPTVYYLKNAKGFPVIYNKKKWLSPLMPIDIIQKDGQTSRFYLDQLLKYLNRAPALINENGEVFGHIRKEGLLKQDPAVWTQYQKSGLTESQYSGRFQYRIDSVYRAEVIRGLNPFETHFSFYNISAFNAAYWPDYAMRRDLNRWNHDTLYPTPDFYPRWPDNWQNAKGAYNGYGTVARGRASEIALGDRFFTPFVSAGWGEEEQNIRPAQWLSLLKAMVMLGADFFYTGYFNVTGAGGKWPNGAGPNDSRGYAYQVAMPAYAQAVRSWAPEFFDKGELLNPADSADVVRQFRFKGRAENELILVRKLGKKYLIYGSIQANSNIKGNVPQSKYTTIDLEGNKIFFEIRRQGSMYILDRSDNAPVFYQLDGWHQYEHPYYWDERYFVEAEIALPILNNSKIRIQTEGNKKSVNDFTDYTSFVLIPRRERYPVPVFLRQGKRYAISVRAKTDKDGAILKINVGNTEKTVSITGNAWKIIDAGTWTLPADAEQPVLIQVTSPVSAIEMDWIMLTPEK